MKIKMPKLLQKKWVWVGVLGLIAIVLILSFVYNLSGISALICGLQGEKQATKQKILQVADKKALEEGYEIENMVKDVERESCFWKIHYAPKEDILGGDLEVYVDSTGEIKKVLHGQ